MMYEVSSGRLRIKRDRTPLPGQSGVGRQWLKTPTDFLSRLWTIAHHKRGRCAPCEHTWGWAPPMQPHPFMVRGHLPARISYLPLSLTHFLKYAKSTSHTQLAKPGQKTCYEYQYPLHEQALKKWLLSEAATTLTLSITECSLVVHSYVARRASVTGVTLDPRAPQWSYP